jgi:hypothetical protein
MEQPLTHPPSSSRVWLQSVLREPLTHFVVLGALIFAADHLILAQRGDPQEIVITKEAYAEARSAFMTGMKREPTDAELKVLTDRWVDNEVLYREGLALGMDRGDQAMKDRVVFKVLTATQSGLALPKIDEAGLRAWFESRREQYDLPARFSFEEAVLAASEATPEKLQKFVTALNSQQAPEAEASLRIFKDRPRPNLVQSYGAPFADALEKQAIDSWGVLQSQEGARAVRLTAVTPGRPVAYDEMKERVYTEWKEFTSSQLTKTAIREIAKKYRVRDEGKSS